MKWLSNFLGTGCLWIGVAFIAPVWDIEPFYKMFVTWQFYVTFVMFMAARGLYIYGSDNVRS